MRIKRPKTLFVALALVLGLSLVIVLGHGKDAVTPEFRPVTIQPSGPFKFAYWSEAWNFPGNCLWIATPSALTNHHEYLFDLDHEKITHELVKAHAIALTPDHSNLLCVQTYRTTPSKFIEKMAAFAWHVSRGHIQFGYEETLRKFWLVDVQNNSARKTAEITEQISPPWSDVEWHVSPLNNHAYGLTHDFILLVTNSFIAVDLKSGGARKIPFDGRLFGWWDDQRIVVKDTRGNFLLWEVSTRKTTVLFTPHDLEEFINKNSLSGLHADMAGFTRPNGSNSDFYLTCETNFVARVNHSGPRLTLVMRNNNLNYHRPETISANLAYRVNTGPATNSWKPGKGGIFLHDSTNETTLPLVLPQTNVTFGWPEIHRNKIIYSRNYEIWRVDLNGSNNVRLFPHADKKRDD